MSRTEDERRRTEDGRPTTARLEVAIDRAVREMLDVEPPAGLRGRVLDRIDFSTNSVASAFRRKDNFKRKIAWIAAPLAAAAVIILAVLAPWRQTAPAVVTSAPPSIAKVQPPPVVPPSASPKTAESPRTSSMPLPYATPPAERRPSPRVVEDLIVVAAVAADDGAGTVIDPLAPIAPIVVAGTHPEDIAPKEIAISPMTPIAELQIAPLSPPERRN